MELVTIIVPVYNVEKYIERCVKSLLNQSYQNIEILLIDDGSTDSSGKKCDVYAAKDKRIKIYHKENEGLGLTRNYGISKAQGQFLIFVDSDDYITENTVEILMNKEHECNADIIISNYYYKEEAQKVIIPEKLYKDNEIHDFLLVHTMGNSPQVLDALSYTAYGKLYKKSLFDDYNLCFPSERKLIWEDLVFNTEAFSKCKSIYVMHYPTYYYCFNESSLTHKYIEGKLTMIMVLYNYMCEQIKKLKLNGEAQQRLDTNFIGHIRTCIKLEVFYSKQNGKLKALNNISSICKRDDVQKLIRNYPKHCFNLSQRIYNFFMEKQFAKVVYFLTWMQNKKKRIE